MPAGTVSIVSFVDLGQVNVCWGGTKYLEPSEWISKSFSTVSTEFTSQNHL